MAGNGTHGDHVDKWLRFFASPDPAVQERSLRALLDIDDARIIPALLDAFARYPGRRGLCEALTRHRDPALVEPMLAYVSHPDHFVRESACEVLGTLHDTRATLPLLDRLGDSHPMVRRAAAFALADIGDARAAGTLLRHWQERTDEDSNVEMGLRAALNALGIHYEKRWLRSSQAQLEPDPPGQAATTTNTEAQVAVVASRDDLFWSMWVVHSALGHLLYDGTAGYSREDSQRTLRKAAELPWKLGRTSGRRLRQRLKHLEASVLQTERRWSAASTNLPTAQAEQGARMLSHLKAIIGILEADEDARLHIDQMRAYYREMLDFQEALPWKELR
jgi:HEAT repeats